MGKNERRKLYDTLQELRESELPAPRDPFMYEEEALRVAADSKSRLRDAAEGIRSYLNVASDLEQNVWMGANYGEGWDEETENGFWEASSATTQHLNGVDECLRKNPVEDALLPDIFADIYYEERPVFCVLSPDSGWQSSYGAAMASVAEHLDEAHKAFTDGALAYEKAATIAGIGLAGTEERKKFWEKGRDDAFTAAEGAKNSAGKYRAAAASLGK